MALVVRARCKVVALAVVACALCACAQEGGDINNDPNAGSGQEQYSKLLQRPSFEEITAQYQAMIVEIQEMTSAEFGLPRWEAPKGTALNGAACGFDFPDIGEDGGTRTINGGYSRGNIPDVSWREAVIKANEIAKKYGFVDSQPLRDKPGDHDAIYRDPYGGELTFSTKTNTVLTMNSGCHLTQAAKQRGKPNSST